ncbi:serine hydrolase domain-containing protein [Pontixanthobacter gangjinensis]|uniref:Serine hydrolase n=1 Tax=Pontixanthobacter gangjinensis TaxID=1028742 RepID=A0A6I4SII0_9SPHN|nr:serine hydrolase domain-containing protein [Pontixanthobacter gangjinensis]MXO55413.1 serine hydrolase [Pontixanthobacter gangjinensis]
MTSDTIIAEAISSAGLPGATAMIVDRDSVRFSGAWGEADAIARTPMKLDTICQIASMTKALVSIAAMQLVEQGKLTLDGPIGDVLPELANPQVLTGFGEDGKPQLRAAARPITLRHLLTHTSGLGYFFVHPEVLQYFAATAMPAPGTKASITMPLMFDPGDKWEYSVGTDWVGLAVEAASGMTLGDYLSQYILGPLGMKDTAFRPQLPEDAAKVHTRQPGGGWAHSPMNLGGGEFNSGGGGLSSTAPDYGKFLQMILRGGELNGNRIVSEETIAEMSRNQIGNLRAGYMGSAMPDLAPPFDAMPDQHTGWGLGFMINPDPVAGGRSAGSLAWAGIFNSYYWIDPEAGIAGVFISQLSPFGDAGALEAFSALEKMAYA